MAVLHERCLFDEEFELHSSLRLVAVIGKSSRVLRGALEQHDGEGGGAAAVSIITIQS